MQQNTCSKDMCYSLVMLDRKENIEARWLVSSCIVGISRSILLGMLLWSSVPLAFGDALDTEIRRVVVIHFDTTRVDDFGCYGSFVKTPNVDAIAARGLRYTNAVTCAPYTSPSVATFLTGQYPLRHGVTHVGYQLRPELTTLAEVLKENGFATAGYVSNPILSRLRQRYGGNLGYEQGFDEWHEVQMLRKKAKGLKDGATAQPDCALLTREAIEFVRGHRDDKFFLWMLHFEPHTPYNPPAPYDTMYLDEPRLLEESVELKGPKWKSTPYKHSHELVARHKGEVTMTDLWLGKLLAELEGLDGKTLICIVADHGESFGDGGLWFNHGPNLRHPSTNVPMILACEGVISPGTTDALVDNTDLFPTILELTGVTQSNHDMDGRSLIPTFAQSDPWPDRMVPISTDWYGDLFKNRYAGVRSKFFTLHCQYEEGKTRAIKVEFYDHRNDPKEAIDLSARFPELIGKHMQSLHELYRTLGNLTTGEAKVDSEEMSERLKALGYLE
jgi:arylsulfatase A-like enzyme